MAMGRARGYHGYGCAQAPPENLLAKKKFRRTFGARYASTVGIGLSK